VHTITTTSPIQGNRSVEAEIDSGFLADCHAARDMTQQALVLAYGPDAARWEVLDARLVRVSADGVCEKVLHALVRCDEGSLVQVLAIEL
jgi:hypothetical protein